MKATTDQRQEMIHFICPECNKKYKVIYEKAGRVVGCKFCSTIIEIPEKNGKK